MLGEDINIKDTTLLFATDNIFITAHTNASYVSFTTTVYYDSFTTTVYYDSFTTTVFIIAQTLRGKIQKYNIN